MKIKFLFKNKRKLFSDYNAAIVAKLMFLANKYVVGVRRQLSFTPAKIIVAQQVGQTLTPIMIFRVAYQSLYDDPAAVQED
jgi:hypothetical protein